MTRMGILSLASVLAACGGGGSDRPDARPIADARPVDADTRDATTATLPEDLPDPLPSGPVTGSFVSFNAGLIQVVKGAEERMPLMISALEALDADVLCLNEIYTAYTNPPAFAAELADVYPYAYWTWEGDFQMLSGLLIVSKHPLYRGRTVYYDMGNGGPTVDRMALGATAVNATAGWHLNVVCTHLHAGLPDSDKAIRLSETTQLRAWAATENLDDDPSILLGDMNAGPVPPSFETTCECSTDGELDASPQTCENCDMADLAAWNDLQQTWTDHWDENADFFTSGRDQFLQLAVVPGLFPDEPTQRIDHCMTKGLGSTFDAGGSGTVLTADPALVVDGETLNYLSDHYGIRCIFE